MIGRVKLKRRDILERALEGGFERWTRGLKLKLRDMVTEVDPGVGETRGVQLGDDELSGGD